MLPRLASITLNMKDRYRLFLRRKSVFYAFDNSTKKFQSLNTKDRAEGERLLLGMNEAHKQPAMNLRLARVYLQHSDPSFSSRTWQNVMDEAAKTKRGEAQSRWVRGMREKPFDRIRNLAVIETRAEHFIAMLDEGTVCTNIFLRRLHNFALDMNWLPTPIIVRRQWPKIQFKEKRAVTLEEHQKILAGEQNPEWRAYYQMLWHVGGAQSDVATLRADNVDWSQKVISFSRMKTGTVVQLHFGGEAEQILNDLPSEGFLFPNIAGMKESDRAKAFIRRCRLVRVAGVSLHSYRYAWAERAKTVGYPERFAQEALGHSSKAVHRAYAKRALVKIPSLEEYEKRATEKATTAP